YHNRGNVYVDLGEYNRAIADYDQAIMLGPNYANAFWGRGNAHYELGNYDQAIADYREYERITGKLEPFMEERLAEMEAD
ncbi:MAG: tetratricopeptide repeat protein, partial [Anaerolineae bacterium]|nr:tetratricopeptide repeat protein [Anaerolineae bacterium]